MITLFVDVVMECTLMQKYLKKLNSQRRTKEMITFKGYEIQKTSEGFMGLRENGDYVYNSFGENCFENIEDLKELITKMEEN